MTMQITAMALTNASNNNISHPLNKRRKLRQRRTIATSYKKLSIIGLLISIKLSTISSFTDVSLQQKQQHQRQLQPFNNVPYHKTEQTSSLSTSTRIIRYSAENSLDQQEDIVENTRIQLDDIQRIENNYDILSKKNGHHIQHKNGLTIPTKLSSYANNTRITPKTNETSSSLWSKKYKAKFSNNQKLWSRRHAKSIEEGIRREQQTANLLTSVIEGSFLVNNNNNGQDNDISSSTMTNDVSSGESSSISNNNNKDNTVTNHRILRKNFIRNHQKNKRKNKRRKYGARTIAALIVAFAEEAQGLQVEIDGRDDTPLWDKQIDRVRINFSRLGFKPLQLSGLDQALHEIHDDLPSSTEENFIKSTLKNATKNAKLPSFNFLNNNKNTFTADEIFTHIDKDNSGELDEDELAGALMLAMDPELAAAELTNTTSSVTNYLFNKPKPTTSPAPSATNTNRRNISKEVLKTLASQLVRLYDINDSKGIDRDEYQSMVEDMAALRRAQREKAKKKRDAHLSSNVKKNVVQNNKGKLVSRIMRRLVVTVFGKSLLDPIDLDGTSNIAGITTASNEIDHKDKDNKESINSNDIVDITNKPILAGEGSIVLSNLQLDLRRLIFGVIPGIKKLNTLGGPLILQPFTMTATGSFTKYDLLNSGLLNEGLRLLVARALRRQVRSVRDLLDGAVFYGRTWGLECDTAPDVTVPILTDIEFDEKDRVIISGRARVQASPDAPFIENAFKLRTRIGTRLDGRVIRLKQPEIALAVECPESWERGIVGACRNLKLPIPTKPEPINTYIPLVSPLKVNSNKDGYYLGEDNCIRSIDIKDGALQFEMSAVLRPGRFLGNHYVAFTVPQRTFIVTLDRLKEGMRVARRNKVKRKKEEKQQLETNDNNNDLLQSNPIDKNGINISNNNNYRFKSIDDDYDDMKENRNIEDNNVRTTTPKNKDGFISRFVQGYMLHAMTEKNKEDEQYSRFASAISDWFGGQHDDDDISDDIEENLDNIE